MFLSTAQSIVSQADIRRITKYLSSTNVQLGASYSIGQASTKLFNDGVAAVARYINASPEEVVLGPSVGTCPIQLTLMTQADAYGLIRLLSSSVISAWRCSNTYSPDMRS